jgi:hypothetical protein
MWGALIFLLFFLVIDPTTREAILSTMEQARLQIAVEAPLTYFVLVIVGGSAIVSALIMACWPRVEEKPRRVQVMHRYQGHAESELAGLPRTPAFGLHKALELAYLVLPMRARMAFRRRRRHSGFANLRRQPGA